MKIFLAIGFLLTTYLAEAQFSIATDLSLMRQFGKQQSFWSLAQSVQPSYALTQKESIYLSIGNTTPYQTKGRFITQAKVDTFRPRAIGYTATSTWRTRQFSAGWKHYFSGGYNAESGTSVYMLGGVGLMSIKISTTFSASIDSTHYNTFAPYAGSESVNRLSFDAGLGIEKPMMGNFFWYVEAKAWLHTGSIESPYLVRPNEKITPVMIGAGLRILFGFDE